MSIPRAPPLTGLKIAGKPFGLIPSGIPEHWPSFETCPQFKLGLMSTACDTYPWERDDFDLDFERDHLWENNIRPSPCLIKPEDLERSKRYLRQLRRSRGYDIDCYPHPSLVTPSLFVGKELLVDCMRTKLQKAGGVIDLITWKTGKSYELVEVHKVVWGNFIFLVTFSARDVEEGSEETFLATLKGEAILECLRRPQVDAPMLGIPETITQPAVLPCYIQRPHC